MIALVETNIFVISLKKKIIIILLCLRKPSISSEMRSSSRFQLLEVLKPQLCHKKCADVALKCRATETAVAFLNIALKSHRKPKVCKQPSKWSVF